MGKLQTWEAKKRMLLGGTGKEGGRTEFGRGRGGKNYFAKRKKATGKQKTYWSIRKKRNEKKSL